jgi:hypothetical protein
MHPVHSVWGDLMAHLLYLLPWKWARQQVEIAVMTAAPDQLRVMGLMSEGV